MRPLHEIASEIRAGWKKGNVVFAVAVVLSLIPSTGAAAAAFCDPSRPDWLECINRRDEEQRREDQRQREREQDKRDQERRERERERQRQQEREEDRRERERDREQGRAPGPFRF